MDEITRGTTRPVARGYVKHEGLDYLEMFSPTPILSLIWIIMLTTTLQYTWPLNDWDTEQAFVQSRVDRFFSVGRGV